MISGFASFTDLPAYVPASFVKWPRSSTGENGGSPSRWPSSKSSGPWPGAECTSPVYSATTMSEGTTLWTHGPATVRWYGSFGPSGCAYSSPTRSLPFLVSTIAYSAKPPRGGMVETAVSMSQMYSVFWAWLTLTLVYVNSGFTAIARFAGSVHGVVVQPRRGSSGRFTSGNST